MATGFSSEFEVSGTTSEFKLRVNWSETYDPSANKSTVTITSVDLRSSVYSGVGYYPDGIIKVNGVAAITMNSVRGTHNCHIGSKNTWVSIKKSGGAVATGSVDVVHDADGTKSVVIEVGENQASESRFCIFTLDKKNGHGWGCSTSQTIELTAIETYTLSVSAGTGSSITVNRTSSGYSGASTGNIPTGTRLYYGDNLKITFTASTNYRLVTTTVNNSTFTSGNTHTVAANVSVKSTAQVLASKVGATDANIESTSTITVTKYNTDYYHSLQYKFGNLSGYITSSGGVQSTEVKFKGASVAFTVPAAFYAQIPNAKTGVCTITCRTYSTSSSTTVLGTATTCTFTATASSTQCSPDVTATVIDVNDVTKALTGNETTLIRYRSNAKCTITTTSKNSATIKAVSIAGTSVTPGTANPSSVSLTLSNTDKTSFAFSATDSRGYNVTKTVRPTVVSYIVLTCNPTITRPTPTGSAITLRVTGNMYRGSFGAYSNTLTLQYRYKEDGGSYGSWKTINSASIVFGTSSYRTTDAITLDGEFDYQKSYVFQVRATDGSAG